MGLGEDATHGSTSDLQPSRNLGFRHTSAVNRCVFQPFVAEQNLNHPQIGARLEHVRRIAVPKCMWADALANPGFAGCFLAQPPDHLVADGLARARFVIAREEIRLRLFPAPVLAQNFQQLAAERHVAVMAAVLSE